VTTCVVNKSEAAIFSTVIVIVITGGSHYYLHPQVISLHNVYTPLLCNIATRQPGRNLNTEDGGGSFASYFFLSKISANPVALSN